MKKIHILTKLAALALVLCMMVPMFASCGSNETVMSMTIDGNTYTINEEELSLLMTIKKLDYACNLLLTTKQDTAALWAEETEEGSGITFEQYYKDLVMEQMRAILIEKYLFDKYDLSIPEETLKEHKENKAEAVKNGAGSYKQYYGYTADQYYDIYMQMVARSEAVLEFLFGENGEQKVNDEDLAKYYEENYVGFQYIKLDMNNKISRDEEGNRIRNTSTSKDDDGNEVVTELDSYKTEALTDDEKSEKQNLPAQILAELEAGTATFEELVQKYSDDYNSVNYPDGLFVLKEGTFLYSAVDAKADELEIGEYTKEAISVNSDALKYIVKRVDLKDAVYSDEKYEDFFEDYEESVKYDKYETYIKTFFDSIVVDQAIAGKYTIADTYLSEYADDYYNYYYYYYTSGLLG